MTYYLKIEALAQGDVDVVLALSWRALRHGIQWQAALMKSHRVKCCYLDGWALAHAKTCELLSSCGRSLLVVEVLFRLQPE